MYNSCMIQNKLQRCSINCHWRRGAHVIQPCCDFLTNQYCDASLYSTMILFYYLNIAIQINATRGYRQTNWPTNQYCSDVTIFFKIIIFNICLHNLVCFGETLSKLLLFFWYVEKWGRYARFCISKYSPKCLHRYKVNWQISVTHWNNK